MSAQVRVKLNESDSLVTIDPGEQFCFEIAREFREATKGYPSHTRFVIDLRNTKFMDSAALGMLLLLRETYDNGHRIQLANANAHIQKILSITRFERYFDIG